MSRENVFLLGVVLVVVAVLLACNDSDEQKTATSKTSAEKQPATQQKAEAKSDTDEDAEGAATPTAAVPEAHAPQQASGKQFVYNFDTDTINQMPGKFQSAKTGGGNQEKWAVIAESTASSKPNVVAQTSDDKTDYRFPLLIADEGSFKDLDLSVKFKAVSGSVDRAGGLVFRLKDPNNYYIVRANALEDNYRLYHVVNGRRVQFAGADLKVTSGEWHELRVEAVGNKIACYYHGRKEIDASDHTFNAPGKIGLCPTSDS